MELLTVKEVAELLKLKPGKIYELKAEHKIPYVKIGGALRFRRSDIESWIQELTPES